MADEKTTQEKLRSNFIEIREKLKREMAKVVEPVGGQELNQAFRVKKDLATMPAIADDDCLNEAIGFKQSILETRAKCVASGMPDAAKIFADSLERVNKMISAYERRKNLGQD